MSKNKIFIGIAISFAAGVLLGSLWIASNSILFVTAGFLLGMFAVCYVSRQKFFALTALFLICAVFGIIRINVSRVENEYKNFFDTKQELEGHIVEDIDTRLNKQLITFQPNGFHQRLLITARLGGDYFYGDRVVVYGKITQPQISDTFDYQAYLQRYNVYGLVQYPTKVLIIKSHQQNRLVETLLRVRHTFTDHLAQYYSEPQNSLLLGILIGAKKTLPQDVIDNFNATGTSHIIAISGFNITIIIASLAFLAQFFGRKSSFWISLMIILGFVILTGASASVVRAAIMGSLLLVSFTIGRQYRIATALIFAGFVMILINPKILYVDVGFQLSFAATLGIIYFTPQFERLTAQWGKLFGIKTVLVTTLSAIIATLPLLLLNFGTLSLVAPIVNILILPLLPLTMLLGFLSVLPFVGSGFAYATNFLLVYMLRITKFFAHVPYGNIPMQIPWWFFIVLIIAIFMLYFVVSHYADQCDEVVEESGEV
jgi:competence protein ComEC